MYSPNKGLLCGSDSYFLLLKKLHKFFLPLFSACVDEKRFERTRAARVAILKYTTQLFLDAFDRVRCMYIYDIIAFYYVWYLHMFIKVF